MARPLSPRARTQMLEAAQDVIVRLGVDACTVDEVAKVSGVAKTTIYRHFDDADDLAIAAVDHMIAEIVAPDTGSLRTDLRAVVLGFRRILEHESARRVFVSLLNKAIDDPDFENIYVRAQELRHAPLRRVLQRAMARGEVDPEIDLDQAMFFTQGPFLAKRICEFAPLTDGDIEVFVDLVCRALAPATNPATSGQT